MYCSGCGTSIQHNLIYCSRCGRRVAEDSAQNYSPAVIAAYTAGTGFMAFIFVLLIVAKTGGSSDLLLKVSAIYFAALIGISYLILRHGSQGSKMSRLEGAESGPGPHAADQLRPVITSQLEEGRDRGIGSVTEVTTRTLDEVLIERK
ncbi:MAG: hypothetical protein IPM25_04075 [Chloracidobacterium sp.]|nr:hypothetical protein [Chloracidobacterium sp.]